MSFKPFQPAGTRRMFAIVVFLALSLAGCGSGEPSDDEELGASPGDDSTAASGESPGSSTTEEFDDLITIGFVAELSGAYQAYGYPSLNGLQVAIDQLNEQGGVTVGDQTYGFDVSVCESNSDEGQAVACAQRFVRDENLKFVMGGVGPLGLAIAAVTDPAGVLYFGPGSALAVNAEEFDYAFAVLPAATLRVSQSVRAVQEIYPDVESVGFVVSNDPTIALLPDLQAAFEEAGIAVVASEEFDLETLDVTPQLRAVLEQSPDLLFTGWGVAEAAPVLQANQDVQAAEQVFTWGPGNCDTNRTAIGDQPVLNNDLTGADLRNAEGDDPAGRFAQRYEDWVENGSAQRNPANMENIDAALFYADPLAILATAIEELGSLDDADALADALTATSIDGLQGTYSFNAVRQAVTGTTFCTVNIEGPGERGSIHMDPPPGTES